VAIRNLLFDFDGTIADSSEGITASVLYALKKYGMESRAGAERVRAAIGPPLLPMLKTLLGEGIDEEQLKAVALSFREHYNATGLFRTELYGGIAGALESLSKKYALYIVSSKPKEFIDKLLPKLGVEKYFRAVYGPGLGFKPHKKAELIAELIKDTKMDPGEALMIGDTAEDVLSAKENGIKTIGVSYGFGKKDELAAAGAAWMAAAPGEILELLMNIK
jgi:phosphoglycolate phosphatase